MTRLELITNIGKLVQHEIKNYIAYATSDETTVTLTHLKGSVDAVLDNARVQALEQDQCGLSVCGQCERVQCNCGIDRSDHKQNSSNDRCEEKLVELFRRVMLLETQVNGLLSHEFRGKPIEFNPTGIVTGKLNKFFLAPVVG